MEVLYGNDAFSILVQLIQFFEESFLFRENLFKSWSIENAQNFPWLSHKNMPISQTEGYFENP